LKSLFGFATQKTEKIAVAATKTKQQKIPQERRQKMDHSCMFEPAKRSALTSILWILSRDHSRRHFSHIFFGNSENVDNRKR
jgi:hypothetical protein